MAYGIKFYGSYKRRSGSTTTIVILKKDYSGDASELTFQADPLIISKDGNFDNIFSPTIGTGATIKIYAQALSMLELFTEDPQEFKVQVYDGTTGGTITWQGFINTSIYSEDYSLINSVPITIECNDGMSTLELIDYKIGANVFYTGTTSISTILTNILSKIDLSFDYIYTSNDLRIADYTTNPFLYLKLSQENFINEILEPMNCREVLNSIIGGLGLSMWFRGKNIYLIDPINLHTITKGKRYNMSPTLGAGESEVNVGGYLDISNGDILWYETGMKLDILPSFHEVSVHYDPYNYQDTTYNFNDKSNHIDETSFFLHPNNFYMSTGNTFLNWYNEYDFIGLPEYSPYIGMKENINSSAQYFFDLSYFSGFHISPYTNILQDQNMGIKISCEVYVHSKKDTANIFDGGTPNDVFQVKIPITIKIGNQYWEGGNSWLDFYGIENESDIRSNPQPMIVREEGINSSDFANSRINDKWTSASIVVPMKQSSSEVLIEGTIKILIDPFWIYDTPFDDMWLPYVGDPYTKPYNYILLKNINLHFIDIRNGETIGNDGIKTTFKISDNLTNKNEFIIKTTTGTGNWGCSRGALKTDQQVIPGLNIQGLIRGTANTGGTVYNTSNLILQSVASQYQKPRLLISGSLDVSTTNLCATETKLIRDSNYLNSTLSIFAGYIPSFYIVSYQYYDRDEKMDCNMMELESTRLDIP